MKFSDPADAALVAEALQRALIYRLLASAFLGPSEARLCELALGAATAAAAARGPLRERLARLAPGAGGGGAGPAPAPHPHPLPPSRPSAGRPRAWPTWRASTRRSARGPPPRGPARRTTSPPSSSS